MDNRNKELSGRDWWVLIETAATAATVIVKLDPRLRASLAVVVGASKAIRGILDRQVVPMEESVVINEYNAELASLEEWDSNVIRTIKKKNLRNFSVALEEEK